MNCGEEVVRRFRRKFFVSFSRATRKKKISERPDLTKTQERQRKAFIYKFISQTSTIIYREEDNRHK